MATENAQDSSDLIDLMTIAALSRWCDQASEKLGRDSLMALLQISAISSKLADAEKELLLALLPLFAKRDKDTENVSAREFVSLMAELDMMRESRTNPNAFWLNWIR